MPLYYFDIYNDETTTDPEGHSFDSDAAAMAYALIETRALAAESVRAGHLVGAHRLEVRDADHNPVGTVRFDEAVAIS